MTRKQIIPILVVLALVIVGLVLMDLLQSRPDKRPENPYEYSVDEFKEVDTAHIAYRETINFTFGDPEVRGIAFANDRLYLVEDNYLVVASPEGDKLVKVELPESPRCVASSQTNIFIGYRNRIRQYTQEGQLIREWESLNDSAAITSLAVADSLVFAADAGNRRVLRYRTDGTLAGSFSGRRDSADLHGFIIPSPYFDLAVNSFGELWVVNPGRHAFEDYSVNGTLRGFWERTSMTLDGFSGCCNPAHMAVLSDGSFVTAEKGMVRIKIHSASGELLSVVAPPAAFEGTTVAPDLAVSPQGTIYALDYEKNLIRVFEKK
jgi:sugar lactone lactonase YvrE